MPKFIGYFLIASIFGVALISVALILWVWIRASNETHNDIKTTPTKGAVLEVTNYTAGITLADGTMVSLVNRFAA